MHHTSLSVPTSRLLVVLLLSALAVSSSGPSAIAQSAPALLYAVTASNRLIAFDAGDPGRLLGSMPITNLAAGEQIVGIDVRPANNWLYGLGSSNQLYLINQFTGAATRIGAPFTPALTGAAFGFDFNPTVDRIRVVTNTGQNLRLHPDTGAVAAVDGALRYAPADPNASRTPRIVGAAYTNPDNDPGTGTTLFDVDSLLDISVTQNPPNDGVLNTFAPLGADAGDRVGFDISLTSFFLSVQPQGSTTSVLIQVTNGQRRDAGTIGGGEAITGLAASLGAPFVAPSERVYAVAGGGELVSFNASAPGTILTRSAITGLNAGERIAGIDFRPVNNWLYGLGTGSQLYVIDPRSGVASRVGAPLSTPLAGNEFGFDFNPSVDRIRVVSDTGQNLRLHPDTGAIAAVDGALAFAPADVNAGRTPRVVGAAYTNPDNNPATGTTLFVIDAALDIGAIQDPPNAGTLNTFMPLGGNATDVLGFDIGATRALIAVAPGGSSPSLLFDVANGARRNLGVIGSGETIRGIAISLTP